MFSFNVFKVTVRIGVSHGDIFIDISDNTIYGHVIHAFLIGRSGIRKPV